MTAHYLTHSTFQLKPADTALVHAAAGGAGLLIVQMAKMRGARVIGTTSTEEKAGAGQGCGRRRGHPVHRAGFRSRGEAADRTAAVSMSSTTRWGHPPSCKSLNSLRPRGMMVSFGNASGAGAGHRAAPPEPEGLAVPDASHAGQLHRHSPRNCTGARATCSNWIASGKLKVRIHRDLPALGSRPGPSRPGEPRHLGKAPAAAVTRTEHAQRRQLVVSDLAERQARRPAGLLARQHPLPDRFHGQQRARCCSCPSRPCCSPTPATSSRPRARLDCQVRVERGSLFLAVAEWLQGKRIRRSASSRRHLSHEAFLALDDQAPARLSWFPRRTWWRPAAWSSRPRRSS